MSSQQDQLDPRRCNAKTRANGDCAGEPCRNWAGQRTEHQGVGRCWLHGGRTPSQNIHAVKVEVQRRMVTMGEPVTDVSAPEALLGLLRTSVSHVTWLQHEVGELDSLSGNDAEVLVNLYNAERDRLARISEACVRAGIEERAVQIQQERVAAYVRIVVEAAEDVGLTKLQVSALGKAIQVRSAREQNKTYEAEQGGAELVALVSKIDAEDERRVVNLAEKRARGLTDLTFPPDELVPTSPAA